MRDRQLCDTKRFHLLDHRLSDLCLLGRFQAGYFGVDLCPLAAKAEVVPSFAPVQIAATEAGEAPKLLPASDSRARSVVAARIGLIEIDLGNRRRIRVDAHVDPEALARVLEVLERR